MSTTDLPPSRNQKPSRPSFHGLNALVAAIFIGLWLFFVSLTNTRTIQQTQEESNTYIDNLVTEIQAQLSRSAFITKAVISEFRLKILTENENTRVNFLETAQSAFKEIPELYQVRIIHQDGQELFRVNRDLTDQALQNKAGRDYIDLPRLAFGELYLSAINLNVEDGQIETPFRPTYRISGPLKLPPLLKIWLRY